MRACEYNAEGAVCGVIVLEDVVKNLRESGRQIGARGLREVGSVVSTAE